LEAFVNFCEDAIFEMQHASGLMASDEEGGISQARQAAYKLPTDEEEQYETWNSQIYSKPFTKKEIA
jgi:ryanodine receptor 2